MRLSCLKTLPYCPATALKRLEAIGRANSAFASMISGGLALNGPKTPSARRTWRSLIIIRRNIMALTAIHPGEHLAEELKELGMSAAELARQLDVPTNRVTEILNGRRAITGDTALRLAHFFGTTAEFWLNLQSLYQIRLAKRKSGKSISALPKLKRFEHVNA